MDVSVPLMPKLERQPWRAQDAVNILQHARIVGRAQGSAADGGRFDGLIIEVDPVEQHFHRMRTAKMQIVAEGTPEAILAIEAADKAAGRSVIGSSIPSARIRASTVSVDGGPPIPYEEAVKPPAEAATKRFVVYWMKGTFLVEELQEGGTFVCETCGAAGIVGVDGPLYGSNGGLDRDPRDASPPRCQACP